MLRPAWNTNDEEHRYDPCSTQLMPNLSERLALSVAYLIAAVLFCLSFLNSSSSVNLKSDFRAQDQI